MCTNQIAILPDMWINRHREWILCFWHLKAYLATQLWASLVFVVFLTEVLGIVNHPGEGVGGELLSPREENFTN